MVKGEKACVDCGATVIVEMPVDQDGLPSAISRALGVMCADCTRNEAQREAERHREALQDAREGRARESGMPTKLKAIRFASLEQTPQNRLAIERAEAWGRSQIKGLVLQGPVGVGKTWTAAAAANLLLDRKPLRWMSVSRMLAQARAGFKTKERDEVTAILLNPTLTLILDDIDKANPTEFAKDILFQAIDERVNADTPLLVTTNKRYNELHDTYGEAIASRLAGYCEGVRIEGEDRRQPNVRKAA